MYSRQVESTVTVDEQRPLPRLKRPVPNRACEVSVWVDVVFKIRDSSFKPGVRGLTLGVRGLALGVRGLALGVRGLALSVRGLVLHPRFSFAQFVPNIKQPWVCNLALRVQGACKV